MPASKALHPERESLATLKNIRQPIGEYNFASQYQQSRGHPWCLQTASSARSVAIAGRRAPGDAVGPTRGLNVLGGGEQTAWLGM
jgi:hypothetical protein